MYMETWQLVGTAVYVTALTWIAVKHCDTIEKLTDALTELKKESMKNGR